MSDNVKQLPIDASGACMLCGQHPAEEERLICTACASPWHPPCLASPPETRSLVGSWECPDCSGLAPVPPPPASGSDDSIVARTRAIEADLTLTPAEKARLRQDLLTGSRVPLSGGDGHDDDVDDKFICRICMQLLYKPVSMGCGHNACLKCLKTWINKGNRTCVTCRTEISKTMASRPKINDSIVDAIRLLKSSNPDRARAAAQACPNLDNDNRPDAAFTTERAKKKGRANAASGKIFVRVPEDHFGPILAEHDPEKNLGVSVGDMWEDRQDCRQWGVHRPHIAGIAGQGKYGAQSVVLAGGYEDDEDHGEWFLYTGSGGRDLSGNKRTNKEQSFNQKFTKYNEALRRSCLKGYPVRVVRSSKEKRSSYVPSKPGYRYDGIYRIEKCWRKDGAQGFKVCRFLFVRCDNSRAPWSSDEHGDRPRELPEIPELALAENLVARVEQPSWDFDAADQCWKWTRPPPHSVKASKENKQKRGRKLTATQQLQKAFGCKICSNVMTLPVTSPCAHNFCKSCLEDFFSGQAQVRERSAGGRSLRTKKIIFKCPSCSADITDFLKNLQVNRELESAIQDLQKQAQDSEEPRQQEDDGSVPDNDSDDLEDSTGEEEEEDDDEEEEEEDSVGDEKVIEVMDVSSAKRQKVDAGEGTSSSASENAPDEDTEKTPPTH
uniref:RING-type E3 ubiquitin transferase n=1 Tax=Kalanchoe fedtschenkoi TaxID=63787 RepID=A0A7N0US12_KALFE